MQRQILLSAAIALSSVAKVAGQAATTTANPLNNFIGAAGAAASQISSANAAEAVKTSSSSSSTSPSTTPTPPPPAATSKAAAASSGLSEGAKVGIIVGAIIAALLILAIIAGICCCLVRSRRRRKRRAASPVEGEGSPRPWKSPINPGRHYSNYSPAQRGEVPMEQHPTVPLMAAAATDHNARFDKPPSLSQHPAMRQPENPFVPVPPSPRRTEPNHRSGVTAGLIAGAGAGAGVAAISHHRHHDRSHSRDNLEPQSTGLPTHNDLNRPPTPFGLTAFGTPAGQTVHRNQTAQPDRTGSPPYSGIGQPYDDMHVHVLQTDAPSRELRHSLNQREQGTFPAAMYEDPNHPKYRNSRGYSTPPEVPSRSPNRQKRASMFADSSCDSSLSTTTESNSSGERYQRQPDPYGPAQRESVQPWQQHQQRFGDSTRASAQMTAPPVPWEESEYNQNRRQSHSPRWSGQYDRRRNSRSPATSINGAPRRLRFEDLQAGGGGLPQQQQQQQEYSAVPAQGHASHDSCDGYWYDQRWSQGVGEAL